MEMEEVWHGVCNHHERPLATLTAFMGASQRLLGNVAGQLHVNQKMLVDQFHNLLPSALHEGQEHLSLEASVSLDGSDIQLCSLVCRAAGDEQRIWRIFTHFLIRQQSVAVARLDGSSILFLIPSPYLVNYCVAELREDIDSADPDVTMFGLFWWQCPFCTLFPGGQSQKPPGLSVIPEEVKEEKENQEITEKEPPSAIVQIKSEPVDEVRIKEDNELKVRKVTDPVALEERDENVLCDHKKHLFQQNTSKHSKENVKISSQSHGNILIDQKLNVQLKQCTVVVEKCDGSRNVCDSGQLSVRDDLNVKSNSSCFIIDEELPTSDLSVADPRRKKKNVNGKGMKTTINHNSHTGSRRSRLLEKSRGMRNSKKEACGTTKRRRRIIHLIFSSSDEEDTCTSEVIKQKSKVGENKAGEITQNCKKSTSKSKQKYEEKKQSKQTKTGEGQDCLKSRNTSEASTRHRQENGAGTSKCRTHKKNEERNKEKYSSNQKKGEKNQKSKENISKNKDGGRDVSREKEKKKETDSSKGKKDVEKCPTRHKPKDTEIDPSEKKSKENISKNKDGGRDASREKEKKKETDSSKGKKDIEKCPARNKPKDTEIYPSEKKSKENISKEKVGGRDASKEKEKEKKLETDSSKGKKDIEKCPTRHRPKDTEIYPSEKKSKENISKEKDGGRDASKEKEKKLETDSSKGKKDIEKCPTRHRPKDTEIDPSENKSKENISKSKDGGRDASKEKEKKLETDSSKGKKDIEKCPTRHRPKDTEIYPSEKKSKENISKEKDGGRDASKEKEEKLETDSSKGKKDIEKCPTRHRPKDTEIDPSENKSKENISKSKDGGRDASKEKEKKLETDSSKGKKDVEKCLARHKPKDTEIDPSENKSKENISKDKDGGRDASKEKEKKLETDSSKGKKDVEKCPARKGPKDTEIDPSEKKGTGKENLIRCTKRIAENNDVKDACETIQSKHKKEIKKGEGDASKQKKVDSRGKSRSKKKDESHVSSVQDVEKDCMSSDGRNSNVNSTGENGSISGTMGNRLEQHGKRKSTDLDSSISDLLQKDKKMRKSIGDPCNKAEERTKTDKVTDCHKISAKKKVEEKRGMTTSVNRKKVEDVTNSNADMEKTLDVQVHLLTNVKSNPDSDTDKNHQVLMAIKSKCKLARQQQLKSFSESDKHDHRNKKGDSVRPVRNDTRRKSECEAKSHSREHKSSRRNSTRPEKSQKVTLGGKDHAHNKDLVLSTKALQKSKEQKKCEMINQGFSTPQNVVDALQVVRKNMSRSEDSSLLSSVIMVDRVIAVMSKPVPSSSTGGTTSLSTSMKHRSKSEGKANTSEKTSVMPESSVTCNVKNSEILPPPPKKLASANRTQIYAGSPEKVPIKSRSPVMCNVKNLEARPPPKINLASANRTEICAGKFPAKASVLSVPPVTCNVKKPEVLPLQKSISYAEKTDICAGYSKKAPFLSQYPVIGNVKKPEVLNPHPKQLAFTNKTEICVESPASPDCEDTSFEDSSSNHDMHESCQFDAESNIVSVQDLSELGSSYNRNVCTSTASDVIGSLPDERALPDDVHDGGAPDEQRAKTEKDVGNLLARMQSQNYKLPPNILTSKIFRPWEAGLLSCVNQKENDVTPKVESVNAYSVPVAGLNCTPDLLKTSQSSTTSISENSHNEDKGVEADHSEKMPLDEHVEEDKTDILQEFNPFKARSNIEPPLPNKDKLKLCTSRSYFDPPENVCFTTSKDDCNRENVSGAFDKGYSASCLQDKNCIRYKVDGSIPTTSTELHNSRSLLASKEKIHDTFLPVFQTGMASEDYNFPHTSGTSPVNTEITFEDTPLPIRRSNPDPSKESTGSSSVQLPGWTMVERVAASPATCSSEEFIRNVLRKLDVPKSSTSVDMGSCDTYACHDATLDDLATKVLDSDDEHQVDRHLLEQKLVNAEGENREKLEVLQIWLNRKREKKRSGGKKEELQPEEDDSLQAEVELYESFSSGLMSPGRNDSFAECDKVSLDDGPKCSEVKEDTEKDVCDNLSIPTAIAESSKGGKWSRNQVIEADRGNSLPKIKRSFGARCSGKREVEDKHGRSYSRSISTDRSFGINCNSKVKKYSKFPTLRKGISPLNIRYRRYRSPSSSEDDASSVGSCSSRSSSCSYFAQKKRQRENEIPYNRYSRRSPSSDPSPRKKLRLNITDKHGDIPRWHFQGDSSFRSSYSSSDEYGTFRQNRKTWYNKGRYSKTSHSVIMKPSKGVANSLGRRILSRVGGNITVVREILVHLEEMWERADQYAKGKYVNATHVKMLRNQAFHAKKTVHKLSLDRFSSKSGGKFTPTMKQRLSSEVEIMLSMLMYMYVMLYWKKVLLKDEKLPRKTGRVWFLKKVEKLIPYLVGACKKVKDDSYSDEQREIVREFLQQAKTTKERIESEIDGLTGTKASSNKEMSPLQTEPKDNDIKYDNTGETGTSMHVDGSYENAEKTRGIAYEDSLDSISVTSVDMSVDDVLGERLDSVWTSSFDADITDKKDNDVDLDRSDEIEHKSPERVLTETVGECSALNKPASGPSAQTQVVKNESSMEALPSENAIGKLPSENVKAVLPLENVKCKKPIKHDMEHKESCSQNSAIAKTTDQSTKVQFSWKQKKEQNVKKLVPNLSVVQLLANTGSEKDSVNTDPPEKEGDGTSQMLKASCCALSAIAVTYGGQEIRNNNLADMLKEPSVTISSSPVLDEADDPHRNRLIETDIKKLKTTETNKTVQGPVKHVESSLYSSQELDCTKETSAINGAIVDRYFGLLPKDDKHTVPGRASITKDKSTIAVARVAPTVSNTPHSRAICQEKKTSNSKKSVASTSTSNVPARTLTSNVAASTSTSNVPARTSTSNVPASTSTSNVPARTSTSNVPASTSKLNVAASTSTSNVPASTSTSNVPARTSTSNVLPLSHEVTADLTPTSDNSNFPVSGSSSQWLYNSDGTYWHPQIPNYYNQYMGYPYSWGYHPSWAPTLPPQWWPNTMGYSQQPLMGRRPSLLQTPVGANGEKPVLNHANPLYRTKMCWNGPSCTRTQCDFAHHPWELIHMTPTEETNTSNDPSAETGKH